jgi:tetratricopeptide (TPR) repeat protein
VAWRLAQSLVQRGQVPEALALCRETAAGLTGSEDVLLAQLAAVQSGAHLMLSQYRDAQEVASQACDLADCVAATAGRTAVAVRARAYTVLGITARLQGQPESAASWLRRSVAAAQETGLAELAGRALFNMGAIAHEGGGIGRAERLYEEALAKTRPAGDVYGTARVLHSLGMIRHLGAAPRDALALLAESCALKRRIGDPQGRRTRGTPRRL